MPSILSIGGGDENGNREESGLCLDITLESLDTMYHAR
jgi:hypothetical protein